MLFSACSAPAYFHNAGSFSLIQRHAHLVETLHSAFIFPPFGLWPSRIRMTSSAAWAERLRVLARPLAWPRPAQAVGASALIALVVALLLWARAPEYKVLFSN